MQIGNPASQPAHNGGTYLLRFVANYPDSLRIVEAFNGYINQLISDIIGNQRIHRPVPAEHEACASQYKKIKKHDRLSNRKRHPVIKYNRNNLRTIQRPAKADNQTYSDSQDDAAKNRSEKGLVGQRPYGVKQKRYKRHDRNAIKS
ncbi:hypothetical protein D3C78_905290 [compost metagenome]